MNLHTRNGAQLPIGCDSDRLAEESRGTDVDAAVARRAC